MPASAQSGNDSTPEPTPDAHAGGPEPVSRFRIVGVGASAGGVESVTELLRHVPPESALCFIVVQHLDPHHLSLLPKILQRNTSLSVLEARDGVQVEKGHAYVIPPNTVITLKHRTLQLTGRATSGQPMPVDTLFRSLAQDLGRAAIGVVLSGTASDGTLGLEAIKTKGGTTFAQEPESAAFDGMPRSAISAGFVDLVLTPMEIAGELLRISGNTQVTQPAEPAAIDPLNGERSFAEIFSLLRTRSNIDFSLYKPGTIRRRIFRRMALHKTEDPEAYARLLRDSPTEVDALFKDVLIHVTFFFREPATFEALRTRVFPALLEGRTAQDGIRVWVPGCSSGEEVYSIAMTLLEAFDKCEIHPPVQIFGTDVSEARLDRARAGTYPESISAEVSAARLLRFFTRTPAGYQINRNVRQMCIFARQNLASDPPFSRLDLLVCRNVLIYLGPVLHKKAMQLFHYALKPTGYMVLGVSEAIGASSGLFAPLDRENKIYRPRTGRAAAVQFETREESQPEHMTTRPSPPENAVDVQNRMDQALLARYTPPSLLLNLELRILHFRGPANKFLENPTGEASLQMMKLAKDGLSLEIRNLVQQADRQQTPVEGKTISVPVDGSVAEVKISVSPIRGIDGDRNFLVVFEEQPSDRAASRSRGQANDFAAAGDGDTDAGERSPVDAQMLEDIQKELGVTRRYLQAVIEDQEAITEELKSANEEIQSSNEELQSTNEELLTAKEELQSTNEELTTVNDEMQNRNDELLLTNNDLFSLLSSVNIPIVMLGTDLKIRRFTPQAERILNLVAGDTGRPIGDFKLKINVPDLEQIMRGVVDDLAPAEREVRDLEGRVYTMWIRPYRTSDNRIDGAVLALFDLTERRNTAESRFRRVFEAAADGIVIAAVDSGEILDINPFACRLVGRTRAELLGRSLFDVQNFQQAFASDKPFAALQDTDTVRREIHFRKENGERIQLEVLGNVYLDGARRVVQIYLHPVSPALAGERMGARDLEGLRLEMQQLDGAGKMARFISASFNNAVTAILLHCDLLLKTGPQGKLLDGLQKIREAALKTVDLEKQLRVFGRRPGLGKERLGLNVLIGDMEQLISLVLGEKYRITRRLSPELPCTEANRAQIERIVLNLLLHARRSMPDGGEVIVETGNFEVDEAFSAKHPSVTPGRYASFVITAAMPASGRRTDSRRYDEDAGSEDSYDGQILSLPGTFEAVREAGGQVWAVSEFGVGSSTRVFFPAAEPLLLSAPGMATKDSDPDLRGTETILLFGVDEMARGATAVALESMGYKVIQSARPASAVFPMLTGDGVRDQSVDLVVIDLTGDPLPPAFPQGPPRVLYLANENDKARSAVAISESELLQKPYSGEQLAKAIRRCLG